MSIAKQILPLQKREIYVKIIKNAYRKELNMNCLFCAIINGDIPSKKIYEDDYCYAFLDINPQAPVHCLVVPKEHIASADEIDSSSALIVANIFTAIPKIAKVLGLSNGYRIISNVGEDGCQSVNHLHFHILGGKKLSETMA